MASTAALFTRPKLETLIRIAVREELVEVLGDPDFGLTILPSVRRRIVRSQRSRHTGKVRDARHVFARLGLGV